MREVPRKCGRVWSNAICAVSTETSQTELLLDNAG